MAKNFPVLPFIFMILAGPLCHAQTSVKVSDPGLEIRDNTLLISYNILNSDPDEKYIISIDIKDETGHTFNATALEGDIGEVEDGRGEKHITWDLGADNVFLDEYVFVQINARVIPPPRPVIPDPIIPDPEEKKVQTEQEQQTEVVQHFQDDQSEEPKKEIKQENIAQDVISKEPDPGKGIAQDTNPETEATKEQPPPAPAIKSTSYNRAGIVIQSIALPGLGLSRVTGKPHWLRGAAGYGSLAGSIILNRKAVKTYNTIDDLVYFDEINEAYDKSLLQDNVSEILSYAAIGIWVTDIIWTLSGTSDLNKGSGYSGLKGSLSGGSSSKGFSLGSRIDPLSNVPMLRVNYRF